MPTKGSRTFNTGSIGTFLRAQGNSNQLLEVKGALELAFSCNLHCKDTRQICSPMIRELVHLISCGGSTSRTVETPENAHEPPGGPYEEKAAGQHMAFPGAVCWVWW